MSLEMVVGIEICSRGRCSDCFICTESVCGSMWVLGAM